MADEPAASVPQPPPGMQRPGIPGAGNLLDPAVRADIREHLHPAVHDAVQRAGGRQPAEAEEPAAEPPVVGYRSRPYPHGDVDLRFLAANVPPRPIRPRRRGAGRRFYFLAEPTTDPAVANTPAVPAPAGPKPG